MSAFEFVAWDGQEYPQEPQVKQKTTRQRQTRQVVESVKSDPAYDTTVQFFNVGQPRYSAKDFGSFAREAYKLDPTAYKAINMVARTAAGIRWKFYTDESMKREEKNHPMIDLWNKPNPRKARTRFIRDTFVFWQIAGNAYIYANRPGKKVPPQELWSLRPDRVKIIPGDNDIQAYHYGSNPYAGKTYEPQDVLHLDFLDPMDDWYGMSPLNPVLAEVDQQNEGRGWNLALMQNAGRTSGALVYPNQIREEMLNNIMRQIDSRISGKRNAGRPLILDSGVQYIEMGKTPLEMDWANLREANVRDIASVLDVAPELVGDAAGKTFANVHEALQSLYTEKVLPMLDEYQDEMNMWLPAMYDQPIYAAYDRNDIEALQENKQVASTRATQGWNSGKLTLNESRKMEGLDELPGGDVLKLNAAIVPVKYLEQYAEQSIVAKLAGLQNAAQAAQQPAPPTAATNDTPQQQNGAQQAQQQGGGNNGSASDNTQPARSGNKPDSASIPGKMAGQERATKVYNLASNEDKAAYLRDMEADREKWTDEATKRIANYFAGEHTAVVKAVKAHPVIADLNTTLQNTVEAHSSKLTSELVKLYQDIGHDIGGKVMDALVAGTQEDEKASGVHVEQKTLPSVSMVSEAIVRRLLAMAGTKVKGIDATTLKLLQVALADGVSEGESIPQLAKRIDDLYLEEIIPNRSTTIASTEVVSASNFASHEAASQFSGQYGIQLKKQWLATEDDRTRPTHADADGQEVDLDEPFDVGGAQLMYPGDFSLGAPASELIRCRCSQIYSRASSASTNEHVETAKDPIVLETKRYRKSDYREFLEEMLAVKHGSHDQNTHGNRYHSRGGSLVLSHLGGGKPGHNVGDHVVAKPAAGTIRSLHGKPVLEAPKPSEKPASHAGGSSGGGSETPKKPASETPTKPDAEKPAEKPKKPEKEKPAQAEKPAEKPQETTGELKDEMPKKFADKEKLLEEKGGKEWQDGLSSKEKDAISEYTNDGYKEMNKTLRNGGKETAQIKNIQAALLKSKAPADMVVTRGYGDGPHLDAFKAAAKSHGVYQEKGFASTTIHNNPNFQGFTVRIHVKKGSPGAYVDPLNPFSKLAKSRGVPPEGEFLLPHGAKFKVLRSKKDRRGKWSFDVEYDGSDLPKALLFAWLSIKKQDDAQEEATEDESVDMRDKFESSEADDIAWMKDDGVNNAS